MKSVSPSRYFGMLAAWPINHRFIKPQSLRGAVVKWLAHPLGTPSFGARYSDRACYILGVQNWLLTLETVYLLWGVVAQWLELRFKTWASSFTPHYLCLSDEII